MWVVVVGLLLLGAVLYLVAGNVWNELGHRTAELITNGST